MEPIKNFSIFRNKKKVEGSKQPDYVIMARIVSNGSEVAQEVGAAYIKDFQDGKYFSCSLKKEAVKDDRVYDGYVMVNERQYRAMKQAYDDWQIKLKNPDYPTPTELSLDLGVTAEDLDDSNWQNDHM